MLPKKGFRKIIVKNETYLYQISGTDEGIRLIIGLKNVNGKVLDGYFSHGFCKNITPKTIRQVIEYALKNNWNPFDKHNKFQLKDFEKHIECVDENIKLSVNNSVHKIEISSDIEHIFKEIKKRIFNEIWISGYNSNLLVLTNKKKAYLMYLSTKNELETCYNSINLAETKDTNKEFLLSNGQMDSYPIKHIVSSELVEKAIIEFYFTGKMWNGICWIKKY